MQQPSSRPFEKRGAGAANGEQTGWREQREKHKLDERPFVTPGINVPNCFVHLNQDHKDTGINVISQASSETHGQKYI